MSSCDEDFVNEKRQTIKIKYTPAEDEKLIKIIQQIGTKDWIKVAKLMKSRNARQCRERWNNYLNPSLNTDPWTPEEDDLLEEKYKLYGAGWNTIAKFFKNRSDNSLRNRHMKLVRAAKKQKGRRGRRAGKKTAQPKVEQENVSELAVQNESSVIVKKNEQITPISEPSLSFPEFDSISNSLFDANLDFIFESTFESW